MSQEPDDIKRWTARRKAAAVMDIIKSKTTAAELARSHDLTIAEVEQWVDDFVIGVRSRISTKWLDDGPAFAVR
jgi:hypothetical protein